MDILRKRRTVASAAEVRQNIQVIYGTRGNFGDLYKKYEGLGGAGAREFTECLKIVNRLGRKSFSYSCTNF